MSFIVTGAGHSGTKFLAAQLNKAKGWRVLHEPTEDISFRSVFKRFEAAGPNYGEVNSYLLTSFLKIPVTKRAVILRNPYDICRSIARSGYGQLAINYVREAISTLDCAISKHVPVILFRKMIEDPDYVVHSVKQLGVDILPEELDVTEVINRHDDEPVPLTFNTITQLQFDEFIERYKL